MAGMFTFRKIIFTLIFWLVFGIFFWLNLQANDGKLNALLQTIFILIASYFITNYLTTKCLPQALRSKKMKRFLMEVSLSVFLLSIVFALIFTYVHIDIGSAFPSFAEQLIKLLQGFYLSIPASLLITGTACGIKFYEEHGKIEREHILLQQAHLESQLKLLQEQINPHTMFNILNHIYILMKNDTQLASFLLLKFSDILRYQLYHCNQNQVILENEIQYLQNLVEVEKLRWGNELEVTAIWQIENKKTFIAPLLLVSFIENAFKYVCRLPEHKGYIVISCKEEKHQISFYVENSYSSVLISDKKNDVNGIGLENVKKRLQLQYPNRHHLKIETEQNIYKVFLTIELSNDNEY